MPIIVRFQSSNTADPAWFMEIDATLDFAVVTGRTFGGGRPNEGLAPSATLTTFCVSGPFPQSQPIERLIDSGVVRMQRVGPDGEAGDILVWENRPL